MRHRDRGRRAGVSTDTADKLKALERENRDIALKPEVARIFAENFAVYGGRKVWRQMQRKGFGIARCTVERPMRDMGLAEVIHRRGPWRSFESVEFAMLQWVDWFNNRRLLEPIGNIPSTAPLQ